MSVIEKLLAIELIKDDRRGKYFHSLTYNEGFDFNGLTNTILKRNVKDILNIFDRYVLVDTPNKDRIKHVSEQLLYPVDEAIHEHYKEIAYEEKEAISADSNRHTDMIKRKKK